MSGSLEALESLCKVKIYQKEASAYDYLGKEIYKEEINTIKQDLERLEHYDNILTENLLAVEHLELTHSELVDLVGDYQILSKKILEQNKQLENENQELKELQELNKQGLWNLKQEKFNQSLFLNGEIDKRQKAIEILKDKPFVLEFGLSVFKWYEEEKIYYYYHEYTEYFSEDLEYRATEYILTKEEYELLKEVLGNE